MTKPLGNEPEIARIVQLLVVESPRLSDLCDLIYHYDKSLGLTYTKIREEIALLDIKKRSIALQNFLAVIHEMKSPNLFINIDDNL